MAYDKVSDYVSATRILLQDTVTEYRYTDAQLVVGLNMAMSEVVRLRPDLVQDLLLTDAVPKFSSSSMSDDVPIDIRYRTPLIFFLVGYAGLIDTEDAQDARATVLLNKFLSQLMTVTA